MQDFRRNLVVVLSCLLAAAVIEAKLPIKSGARELPAEETLASLPYQFGPFSGREADTKADPREIHRFYSEAQGKPIELLAYSTSVGAHGPGNCLPYLGWSIIDREHRDLQVNSTIDLQTVVAVSDKPSERPLVCGYYWRRNNRATADFFVAWLQQRWATFTQSLQDAELVSICTNVDDVRQASPAMNRVYEFANDLEPYFQQRPAPEALAASH